jgi:hypothetical protein
MSCQIVSFNIYSSTPTSYKEKIKEEKKLTHQSRQNLNQTKYSDSPLIFFFSSFHVAKTKNASLSNLQKLTGFTLSQEENAKDPNTIAFALKSHGGSEFVLRIQTKNLGKYI